MAEIKNVPASFQVQLTTRAPRSKPLTPVVGMLLAIGIYWMLTSNDGAIRDTGGVLLLAVSTILVLRWPFWGVVLTMVSLPLTETIYRSSLTQYYLLVVGGLTIVSYLLHALRVRRYQRRGTRSGVRSSIYNWALLFVLWTFFSNSQAALFQGDRIWLLTLVQLLLLTWLAGELFDTPEKHRLLMGAFVMSTLVSAVIALQEASIGNNFSVSVRATGLAGGANTTGRLFVYALLMLSFLLRSAGTRFVKLFGIIGIMILSVGVVATVSRTGFLMLILSLGMIFWDELTKRIRVSILLALMAILVTAILWIPDNYWIFMLKDSPILVLEGTDTIGFRYRLWQAAWQMWQDYPLAGVGIGQFSSVSPLYGAPPVGGYYYVGAHSMLFALLTETGILGLLLYAGLIISALIKLVHVARRDQGEWSGLARTWLFVLLLVLVGGITKHDQYDKFPWLIPGLALAISRAFYQEYEAKE
jgi:O-antigen ligase